MIRIVIMILVVFLLNSCANINSIYSNYDLVDFKDGVSSKEAKTIAQKELLDVGQNENFILSLPDVEDRETHWSVIFSSLHLNRFAYVVNVEKDSGEIIESVETNNLGDVFIK